VVDDVVRVNDKESFLMTRRLVREEGMLIGGSCGLAVAAALKYAAERDLGEDKMVVVLLPDSGTRYLSKIFDDNWMRENRFLENEWLDTRVSTVLERKPHRDLILARHDESVSDVIAKMKQSDVSQLPAVGDEERLLGLVTEVNMLNFLLNGGASDTPIAQAHVIDDNIPALSPETPIEAVMSVFGTSPVVLVTERRAEKLHPVVTGIITKIDLLDFLANRTTS